MTFDNKQLASQFVDDELNSNSDLDQLIDNKSARELCGRYQLISELIKDKTNHFDLDISSQVSTAIADEQPLNSEVKGSANVISFPQRIWKQAGGFAIAASVALVALVNVQNNDALNNSQTPAPIDIANNAFLGNQNFDVVRAPLISVKDSERKELEKMHQMFIQHQQFSTLTGSGLPTVRVVTNQKVVPVKVPLQAPLNDEQSAEEPEQNSNQ